MAGADRITDVVPKETNMENMVGKPAVPFELKDADGNVHRLEDYRDKWLLLVFHRHLG